MMLDLNLQNHQCAQRRRRRRLDRLRIDAIRPDSGSSNPAGLDDPELRSQPGQQRNEVEFGSRRPRRRDFSITMPAERSGGNRSTRNRDNVTSTFVRQ
jgi:hypothetical protein